MDSKKDKESRGKKKSRHHRDKEEKHKASKKDKDKRRKRHKSHTRSSRDKKYDKRSDDQIFEKDHKRAKPKTFETENSTHNKLEHQNEDKKAQAATSSLASSLAKNPAELVSILEKQKKQLEQTRKLLLQEIEKEKAKKIVPTLPKPSHVGSMSSVGPRPLLLDEAGNEIDEFGNVIATAPKSAIPVSESKPISEASKIDSIPDEKPLSFIDPRMKIPSVARRKRELKFIQPGTFIEEARKLRSQTEFTRIPSSLNSDDMSSLSDKPDIVVRRTGEITSEVPPVEWWDQPYLSEPTNYTSTIKEDKITHFVEHPLPVKPPAEKPAPPPQPLILTKSERRKLRKRNRMEVQQERRDRILLGLEDPPPPKVKIANMMRVLGSEAVGDPTQIEAKVRKEIALRAARHNQRNQERKLTGDERKAKKRRKMFEDTALHTNVAVFRVGPDELDEKKNPVKKFKVDINASQNHLSGCVILAPKFSVVIVEGGPKSINRYKKLMLRRIRWNRPNDLEDDEKKKQPRNKEDDCYLIWEGEVLKPSFRNFRFEPAPTEAAARKILQDRGVVQYYDMCKNFVPVSSVFE